MMTLYSNDNHVSHLLSSDYVPRTVLTALCHRIDLFLPAHVQFLLLVTKCSFSSLIPCDHSELIHHRCLIPKLIPNWTFRELPSPGYKG